MTTIIEKPKVKLSARAPRVLASMRLPAALVDQIDAQARELNLCRNEWIVAASEFVLASAERTAAVAASRR
jgi:hypothetical protein